jgi:hypothetical protein
MVASSLMNRNTIQFERNGRSRNGTLDLRDYYSTAGPEPHFCTLVLVSEARSDRSATLHWRLTK